MFPNDFDNIFMASPTTPIYAFKTMGGSAIVNSLKKTGYMTLTPTSELTAREGVLVVSYKDKSPLSFINGVNTDIVKIRMKERRSVLPYEWNNYLFKQGLIIQCYYGKDDKQMGSPPLTEPIYIWSPHMFTEPSMPQVTPAEVTEIIAASQEETVLKEVEPEIKTVEKIVEIEVIDYDKLSRLSDLREKLKRLCLMRNQLTEVKDVVFVDPEDRGEVIHASNHLEKAFNFATVGKVRQMLSQQIRNVFTEQAILIMDEMKALGVRFSPEEELYIRD